MHDMLEHAASPLEIRELGDAEIEQVDGGGVIVIGLVVLAVGALLLVGYCGEHNRDNQAEDKS